MAYESCKVSSSDRHSLAVKSANRKAFGKRLRQAIVDAGMTIDGFAIAIEMSLSGVRKWLYGNAEPGMDALVKTADALKVNIEWLATGRTTDANDSPVETNSQPTDPEVMGKINDVISRTYKDIGGRISPADMGRMAAKWYDLVIQIGPDLAERNGAVALLAAQLKAELSAPIGVEDNSRRRA